MNTSMLLFSVFTLLFQPLTGFGSGSDKGYPFTAAQAQSPSPGTSATTPKKADDNDVADESTDKNNNKMAKDKKKSGKRTEIGFSLTQDSLKEYFIFGLTVSAGMVGGAAVAATASTLVYQFMSRDTDFPVHKLKAYDKDAKIVFDAVTKTHVLSSSRASEVASAPGNSSGSILELFEAKPLGAIFFRNEANKMWVIRK